MSSLNVLSTLPSLKCRLKGKDMMQTKTDKGTANYHLDSLFACVALFFVFSAPGL